MADLALRDHLAVERSEAVRRLLATPLIDAEADVDTFRLVARHAVWLTDYFEQTCGWTLTVDTAAGFARLGKRAASAAGTVAAMAVEDVPAVARPLRRSRGERAPFDRRRYELLCRVCAELVRHPVTTVGLLATSIGAGAGLDTSRYGERAAFVDVMRVLAEWGALRITAGDVDAFVDDSRANAILTADTARLHRVLVSPIAPSALPDDLSTADAVRRLRTEPRYGRPTEDAGSTTLDDPAPSGGGDEVRSRWARHQLARRLLDDPALYFDDLSDAERSYVTSLSGRRWLRDRMGDAGFELEERTEGLLAIDQDAIATDLRFPAPAGNAHQLALLLADHLVTVDATGRRTPQTLDPHQIGGIVAKIFAAHPGWARGSRDGDGPERLTDDAIDLLCGFGLARREPDGAVRALPGLARYRVAEPVMSGPALSLFEEDLT